MSRRQLEEGLRAGLSYLSSQQSADGGFIGYASPDPSGFDGATTRPTIFATALIGSCLAGVDAAAGLRSAAARFLLVHRSSLGSWNYWVRGRAALGLNNYPDDLDDTACALAALYHHNSAAISGTVMAQLAAQLIQTEVALGGPYRTWLVGSDAPAQWQDVDLAVNANIGYVLSLLDVKVPGLERYVAERIQAEQLGSRYYVGTVPPLYFLARWYQGVGLGVLRELVARALRQPDLSALEFAMLLTAGQRLGLPRSQLTASLDHLLVLRIGDSWPAQALYYEPPVAGVVQYAGSAALSTAFVVEALAGWCQLPQPSRPAPGSRPLLKPGLRYRSVIRHQELRQRYEASLRRTSERDLGGHITGIATLVAEAAAVSLPPTLQHHLNAGSLYGWMAYTIYDDFWDGEGQPDQLGVANVALRRSVASFEQALPGLGGFDRFVEQALATVDGANTWEVVRARAAVVAPGVIEVASLPRYGSYHQLAERSWGHVVAASGSLLAAGYAFDGPELTALREFFQHYLIARQLSDDAHDWEADIASGRLSAVVTLLLRAERLRGRIELAAVLPRLRRRFWQQTVTTVATDIMVHAGEARTAVGACAAIRHPELLTAWLVPLERSARQVLEGHAQAQRFIATYRNQPIAKPTWP